MGRIGIFGGTFNPIHRGHLLAVEEFRRQLALDKVLLIPAATPPHKALPDGSPDAAARLAMARAAAAQLDGVIVSDVELRRGGKSYTADTLRQLREEYVHDELFLLMGTDSYLALERWREPETILRLSTVVCAHRSAETAQQTAALEQQRQTLLQKYHAHTQIIANRFADMSSSTVRRMLALGCGKQYLPEPVWSMIDAQGLYGTHAALAGLPFEKLREKSLSLTKAARVPHVIGCCETAAELAARYGISQQDAARAGILHDVTKALDGAEQLLLCEKYGIILNHFERENPKLLHAKTGAAVARQLFGENDAVCDAICWHTTGKPAMNLLEKIIYLADYMEPNRDFDGVETLRRLAVTDLDAAILRGLEMSLELLHRQGRAIDSNSQAAYNYYRQRKE